MKTAMIAAGMVCALGIASASAAQSGDTGAGPLESFAVEVLGDRLLAVDAGGQQVTDQSDFSSQATVMVPQLWEDRSFDILRAAPNEARSEFDALIESDSRGLWGRMEARADAFSSFDASGSSARLLHELNVSVGDIDVFGDVFITFTGNADLSGFGRSVLTYAFDSDEFSRSGTVTPDGNESFSVLFEDVNITHLEISLVARTEAVTDSPVTNAFARTNADWSVEIIPIPAPGSAAGLLALGGLALRRRR